MTYIQEIHKDKIEYLLQDRYCHELQELETLSFSHMRHMREVVFPFSALLYFYLYPLLHSSREVFRIEYPLRYVIMYPVLINREYDSFVSIFSRGAIFSTAFTDGTQLISTSFPSREVINLKHKMYRYSPKQVLSLQSTWDYHQARILDLESKSRTTVANFSIEQFEQMVHRSQKALICG